MTGVNTVNQHKGEVQIDVDLLGVGLQPFHQKIRAIIAGVRKNLDLIYIMWGQRITEISEWGGKE